MVNPNAKDNKCMELIKALPNPCTVEDHRANVDVYLAWLKPGCFGELIGGYSDYLGVLCVSRSEAEMLELRSRIFPQLAEQDARKPYGTDGQQNNRRMSQSTVASDTIQEAEPSSDSASPNSSRGTRFHAAKKGAKSKIKGVKPKKKEKLKENKPKMTLPEVNKALSQLRVEHSSVFSKEAKRKKV